MNSAYTAIIGAFVSGATLIGLPSFYFDLEHWLLASIAGGLSALAILCYVYARFLTAK